MITSLLCRPLDEQRHSPASFTRELLDLAYRHPRGTERLTLSTLYTHLRRRLYESGLPAPNQRGTDTTVKGRVEFPSAVQLWETATGRVLKTVASSAGG